MQYLIFRDLDVFLSKIVATYINILRSVSTGSGLSEIDTGFGKKETSCGKAAVFMPHIAGS